MSGFGDPKAARFERKLRRILIVEPYLAPARMLAETLRGFGVGEVVFETTERGGLTLADAVNPDIIFVERSGHNLDGETFTRRLRRSHFACRKAPVIMVTADATAHAIRGARDAGVHEFLRKPFTSGDLVKRLDAVAHKPREWIEAVAYVGPDRRRFNSAAYSGPRKRQADGGKSGSRDDASDTLDRTLKIMKAALDQYNSDPPQARRALAVQLTVLKAELPIVQLADLNGAFAALEFELASQDLTPTSLAGPVNRIRDYLLGRSQAA